MLTVSFALMMHARAAGLMLLSHLLRILHDMFVRRGNVLLLNVVYVVLLNGRDDIVTSKVVIFLMMPMLAY